MNSPTIAVYTSTATDNQPPRFNDSYYAAAYADLFKQIIACGGQPIAVYDAAANYRGNSVFGQSWKAVLSGDDITYSKQTEDIQVDILYDKNRFPFNDIKKINPSEVNVICNDKYLSYLFAPDFHPKSFLIENQSQLDTFALGYRNKNVALKELDSSGGEKVFVGPMSDYHQSLEFPLLAQEFIDTSGGVKDLVDGLHDVRVRLFNGQVLGGSLRTPPKNELRSNTYLGGTARALFASEIPAELVDKTRVLDQRFPTTAPRFFSADWGFDKLSSEWKLFEINNMPGVANQRVDGPAVNEYLKFLAESLVDSARL
ncbi:MAG: ATP-grasp domain-containing protein [Sphaerimonospora mesophila]